MKITQNVKLLLFFFFISLLFIAVSAGESKCECSHEDDEENKAGAKKYQIAAIPSVLVAGVIGVLFPLLGKFFPSLRPETNFFFVTKAFAAGVILATGFMHVLPEGYEKLKSPCLKGEAWEFPFTGFIAMVAAILTLSVDSFATSYFHRLHFRTSKRIGDGEEGGRGGGGGGGGGDGLGLHVHAHGHAHGIVASESGSASPDSSCGPGVGGGNNSTLSSNIIGSITKSRYCQSSFCCFNVSSMLRRSWPWWLHRSGKFQLYVNYNNVDLLFCNDADRNRGRNGNRKLL